MQTLEKIALILVIIGGLNWGLIGIANFNLVTTILGEGSLANIVYDLVGVSALVVAYSSLMKNN